MEIACIYEALLIYIKIIVLTQVIVSVSRSMCE